MARLDAEYKIQLIENEINMRMEERRQRLTRLMRDKGLTFEELGKLTGVAKSSIQRYLTGETAKIPIDFFEKVAKVTDTPIEYLTCFDEQKNAPIEGYQSEFDELFRKLNEEKRAELTRYAAYLSEK